MIEFELDLDDELKTPLEIDEVLENCKLEPSLKESDHSQNFQFERKGYFCLDSKDSTKDKLIFNRTIALRDTWAKINKS